MEFAGDGAKDISKMPDNTGTPSGSLASGGPVMYPDGMDKGASTDKTGSGKNESVSGGGVEFVGNV